MTNILLSAHCTQMLISIQASSIRQWVFPQVSSWFCLQLPAHPAGSLGGRKCRRTQSKKSKDQDKSIQEQNSESTYRLKNVRKELNLADMCGPCLNNLSLFPSQTKCLLLSDRTILILCFLYFPFHGIDVFRDGNLFWADTRALVVVHTCPCPFRIIHLLEPLQILTIS